MTAAQYHQLGKLLHTFWNGADRSKAHAAVLEGFLIEHLYEDETFGTCSRG